MTQQATRSDTFSRLTEATTEMPSPIALQVSAYAEKSSFQATATLIDNAIIDNTGVALMILGMCLLIIARNSDKLAKLKRHLQRATTKSSARQQK